ncbi:UPAR/Ly6 domain-containing protein cold [Cloeon dipterum]|uniref:UPAR/Ly6 domain-containing protein cold n=1 Tax=Cloeon dipterum TaxID=197152 RepID=UPI00322099FF
MMLSSIFFIAIFASATALECYVCTNQEHNKDKCLNTIKTCEQNEEMCLTEYKWGSTPYWDQGAAKQFYVSKRCATKKQCTDLRSRYMPFCTYIWYEDWKCSECCQGDRCNYYVILGASSTKSSVTMLAATVGAALMLWRFYV